MTKWSNIIMTPGGYADGVFNTLAWNRIELRESSSEEHGFLPRASGDDGPDGIPAYVSQLCFIKCWGGWPIFSGTSNVGYCCDFVAPYDMVLTKIKFRGRQDVGYGTATDYRANFKVFVNGRAKRIRPEVGHLYDDSWDIWNLLDSNFTEQVLSIRPLVIPKGANVTVQLNMNLFVISSTDWIRIGMVQLGYRAPMDHAILNYSYGNQTKSWLPRKECLPQDSMRLSVKMIDADGAEVGNGVPIKAYHGANGTLALNPFPLSLSSEGIFDLFTVLATVGTETVKLTSDDADGSDGNCLGLGVTYSDKVLGMILDPNDANAPTYPDDEPNNNLFSLPAIIDTFTVAKRTPIVNLTTLPSRIVLHDLTQFQGSIKDPEQYDLRDFVAGMNAQIQRLDAAWMNLENPTTDNGGNFVAQHTMDLPDLGLNKRWRVTTPETAQYNPSTSIIQTRTIWEIVQTLFSRFTFEKPEILKGEHAVFRFTLTEQSSALGVAGNPSIMIQRLEAGGWTDLHSEPLNSDGTGVWTWPEPGVLLPVGLESITVPCRARFYGSTFGFKEYQEAQPSATSNLIINRIPPGLGNLVLGLKLDNKDFAEIIGSKSVHFQLDKPDYYGVRDFYEPAGVLVNPGTYNVTCTLIAGGVEFSKTESKAVAADQDVLMTFSFVSQGWTEGTGRIVITLMSSAQLIKLGETVTLSGSVVRPTRMRSFALPFVKIRIKSGTTVLATTRTGIEGTFAVNLKLEQIGPIPIYAELSGPLGKYPVATSGEFAVTVI